MPQINYIAVLVAAIVSMILGWLWYGPLFGKAYMEGMGIDPNSAETKEKMKQGMASAYVQMFILSLVMFYALAFTLWAFKAAMPGVAPISAGLQGGFWTWLGFLLPVIYGQKLWGGKTFKFVSIGLGYYLVLLLINGVILSVWK